MKLAKFVTQDQLHGNMGLNELYYVYGACTMFYALMTYVFVRKGNRLSWLVALLMFTLGVQCVAMNFFMLWKSYEDAYWWNVQSSLDMVAVPMYVFILMELVKPGRLTVRAMLLQECPYILLPLLFVVSGNNLFYYILVGWTAVYGNFFMIWTLLQIPRYHKRLLEHYSYTENVNLQWLRIILISFYVILGLWILNCVAIHLNVEILYMLVSMAIWMTICYYIYRHEQVLEELKSEPIPVTAQETVQSEIGVSIERLFREERIFLNPQLKLSDVARECHTNRTYVSNYFNQEAGVSFYEYVNRLRIDYACTLLGNRSESIKNIAEQSGFNSPQSFIRTFVKLKGVNPTEFRKCL